MRRRFAGHWRTWLSSSRNLLRRYKKYDQWSSFLFLAEARGFEPPRHCCPHDFESCAFNHSATLPFLILSYLPHLRKFEPPHIYDTIKVVMSKVEKYSETYYTRNRIIALFLAPVVVVLIGLIIFAIVNAPGVNGKFQISSISGDDLSDCNNGIVTIEKNIGTISCDGKDVTAFMAKDGKISPAKGIEVSGSYSVSGDTLKMKIDNNTVEAKRIKE